MLNKIYKMAMVLLLVVMANSALFAAKPYLVSPEDEATCEQKTLEMIWTEVETAKDYSIEIALDEDFTDVKINSFGLTDTSYTAYLNYNSTYFWRVTVNFMYDPSEVSEIHSLTTKQFPPILHTPADLATCILGTTEFTWFGDANNYHLQIALDEDFNKLIVDSANVVGNSFKYHFATFGKKYFWRTAGLFDGCTTEFSETFSFITPNLPLPLYLPENHSIGIPLFEDGKPFNTSFVWVDSTKLNTYRIQISTSTTFASPLIDMQVEENEDFISGVVGSRGVEITDMPLDYNTKYFWRVSSIDNECQSQWSFVFDFRTPYNEVNGVNPAEDDECNSFEETFVWRQNNSASAYRLQIFETADMQDTILNQANILDTFHIVNLEKALYTYFWRVRAEDNNNIGTWAILKYFTTTQRQPNLLSPENNEEGLVLSVNFNWENLSNKEHYYFQLSPDSNFDSLMVDTNDLTATNFNYTFNEYSAVYYWRVKARHNQCYSPWSEIYTFETNLSQPILLLPEDGTDKQAVYPQMVWNTVKKAEYYYLELATNKDFTENSVFVAYINETNAMIPNYDFKEMTTYYWRVRAHKGESISAWSETWDFRTGKNLVSIPELISPVHRATEIPLSIELNWEKSINVEEYILQIFQDELFQDTLIEKVLTDENFIVGDLINFTTYFWRVKSRNIMGDSEWSELWQFRTIDSVFTNGPILTSPKDDDGNVKLPAFQQWELMDRASKYNVQVSTSSDMSEAFEDMETAGLNKQIYNLKYDSKYYWRVRAKNEAGWSPWSQTWSYRTELDPVSVNENSENKARVFPNPVENKAILSFYTKSIGNISIRIKSIEGKTVFNVNYYMSAGDHRLPIYTSDYPKGAYFFIIKTADSTQTGRFIVIE